MMKLLNKLLNKKDTDGLVAVDIATVGLTPPPIPTQVVNANATLAMLPPPFPTTAVVDTWSKKPALAKNSYSNDQDGVFYQTIDPNEDPINPLRHTLDTWCSF